MQTLKINDDKKVLNEFYDFEFLIERIANNVVLREPIDQLDTDAFGDKIFDLAEAEAKQRERIFQDWVFLENLPNEFKTQAEHSVDDHLMYEGINDCEKGSPLWSNLMCFEASRQMIAEAIIEISQARAEAGGGFRSEGIWIDDATVSECGRFDVDPEEYYGLKSESK